MNVRKSNLFEMSRETACNTFFRTDYQTSAKFIAKFVLRLVVIAKLSCHTLQPRSTTKFLKNVPPILDYGKTVFE